MTSRTTRADEYRVEGYRPGSELDIPQEVIEMFANENMHLRWIRYSTAGQDDSRNISKRRREGYEFVQKQELPEKYRDMFDATKIRGNNQIVCIGDLVLAKIPVKNMKARQKYYEDQSRVAVKNAQNEAKENSDARMGRMVPIVDESTTEVKSYG